jgi:hypothetical protein
VVPFPLDFLLTRAYGQAQYARIPLWLSRMDAVTSLAIASTVQG